MSQPESTPESKGGYVAIMVPRAVRDELVTLRDIWTSTNTTERFRYAQNGDRVGLGQIVAELVRREKAHKMRSSSRTIPK